jgi:ABC-2 type transport system ATP-binding protein
VTLTGETVAPRLALQVEDLHVSYGSKRAVDGVSLDINEGEIFGLLGPNGAGKTTTLSAIEGLLRPNAGSIRIGDVDARANPTAAKARMGVQLQSTSFQSDLTVREIVRLYAGLWHPLVSVEPTLIGGSPLLGNYRSFPRQALW